MPTQGERQSYKWRPNDYSSTTLTRYDQEAEHWTKAFRNAANNSPADLSSSISSFVGFVDLLLSLTLSLVFIIIYILKSFGVWAFGSSDKSQDYQNTSKKTIPTSDSNTAGLRQKKIRKILENRPRIFITNRHKLFRRAALIVVLKQKVSFSMLMFELNADFETVSELIDQLYEAGIISADNHDKPRKVFIYDKLSLEMLLSMEKEYFEI